MKKLLSLLLAAVMLLGCTAALAETYALTEETFTLEQGPVWYFMCEEAGSEARELFAAPDPDWGDNWQFSQTPSEDNVYHSICEWDGVRAMPGTWMGNQVGIIAAFKAPKAGAITIDPMTLNYHVEGSIPDKGYEFAIVKVSGEEAVSLLDVDGYVEIPVLLEEDFVTQAIAAEVAEGDMILFIIRATDDGGAAVLLQPSITYAE